MRAFSLELDWFRCRDSYRLVPRGSLGRDGPPTDRIVASSDRTDAYRPFDHFDSLYREFAKVKTADDLLGFVKRFGLLEKGPEYTTDSPIVNDGKYLRSFGRVWELKGNSVPKYLTQARLFREILLRKENGPKSVAAFFRSHEEFGIGSGLTLVADPSTGVEFAVTPHDLIHGLKFQLAQSLIGSTIIRACRWCGNLFEAGAGAKVRKKVRKDSTFCCREHSVLYHSHKRSKDQ
jgi:hypothetical protein